MWSRAACAKAAIACASPCSSTMSAPAAISGANATTAISLTFLRSKTRSLRPSLPRSSRSSMPQRIFVPGASLRTVWMLGIWSCGRCRMRVTRQDNMVAQALLEKAIAIDPNYGQVLGVLAASYTFSAHMGWVDMATAVQIAERAALAAIQSDSEDPWAHHALGCVYLFTRRFEDSLAELELALDLNPNFSLAQGYYGLALSYCGRWEEADEAARRALRLSPRDPFAAVYAGIAAYAQFIGRNYDEAMRLAREAIRQRGDFVGAHRVLVAAAGMAGQTEVATAALQELRRAQPNISLAWIADEMPIKQEAEREHYLEAFRRAGLD